VTASMLSMDLISDAGSSWSNRFTSDLVFMGVGEANTVVMIKEGGTTLGTTTADGTGAWSFTPTGLVDGAHTLSATDTDLAGNTGAATLSFTLESMSPTLSIGLVSDTGSSSTDGITSVPAVKGVGEANAAVVIKEGAITLGATMADGTGAWSFTPIGLAGGAHTLTAAQTDASGNTETATLSFTYDKTAPPVTMALVFDTGGSVTDKITSNPAVTGRGDANGVVTIKEGATTLGTTTANGTGGWSFTPTGLSEGAHTFSATETDLAGNTGAATLSFTFDKTVTMALASDTGSSTSDNITAVPAVKGVGQANTAVILTEGGATLGTATANSAGNWSFGPSGLANGAHTLTATQTDAAGDTRAATLSFTLDKIPPMVSMALVSDTGSSSTDKITSNPAVRGVGEANTIVTIKEGGTTLGTTMVDSTRAWRFTPTGLADGAHTLSAIDTDLVGNIGSIMLSFTLDTTMPFGVT
jgi:hypothetical protein